ncbi:MAG: DUF1211 domain-containing protein [Ignavibacteriales bacterium]|nr:DUF1211 domain-containing protein [Ignavibacteriales bacterium]
MARRFFGERQYKDRYGFRWRGGDVSRVEGFSDAVFAFSVTLLIVSLEVPRTFSDLLQTMKGFVAFGASFAILVWIWHVHYVFFRRYGLQDAFTKTVNAVLLFVVLFYVYPLKFVFSNVIHFWSGGANSTVLPSGLSVPILTEGDPATMMIVYGIGFIAVFLCYVLFYWNARRKREELRLTPLELFVTTTRLQQYALCILVGLISIAIVTAGGDSTAALSGFSYILLGPVLGVHGFMSARKWKVLEAQSRQQFHQQRPQQHQGRPSWPQQQRPQGQQGQQRPQGQPRPQGPPRPQGQQGQQRSEGQQQQPRRRS